MFLVLDLLKIYTVLLVSFFVLYSFLRLKKAGFRENSISFRAVTIDNFFCLTFLLASVALYSGFKDPILADYPLQGNLAQFIGTVLAIFFALAIVPVSNVVNNTSSAFVAQIFHNEVFVKSVFLYALIFFAVSLQEIFGFNKTVSVVYLGYLLMLVTTFIFLIYETLRLMDVKNIISDFEKDAVCNLDQRWKSVTSKTKDLEKQLQVMAIIKNTLIFETKTKIEPIFVTTKRYISFDHHDVVAKGLSSILNIANKYIDLFSFSIQDNDGLLNYLIERFKDLKSVITDTSHYSILPNLVWATKQLAIKALDIQTPMSKYNQSYLPLGLVSFLKEFVISKDVFRETSSAPLDAVTALEDIALVAIQKKNFNMARSALDNLSEISVTCTKLNLFFTNQVAKEANAAIMNVHYNMLKFFGKDYRLVPFLIDSITNPIKAFIEVGDDRPTKDNLSPFIGTGVDQLGITDPYSTRFFKHLPFIVFLLIDREEAEEGVILDYLEEIFTDLNRLLMEADDKKMFFLTSEIVDSAYDVAFTLMQFVEMQKIKKTEKVKQIINDRLYYIFLNSFTGSFLTDERWLNEKIHKWFSVLGLYLVTFQIWEGFPIQTIDKVVEKTRAALSKISEEYKGREVINYSVANDLKGIFEYLNLTLYWEFVLIQNSSLKNNLLKFIIENQEKLHKDFDDSRLPRPVTALGRYWMLDQPYVVYFQQFLWDTRIFLDVEEPYFYAYDDFVRKNELIWKLAQLIRFHIGEIKSYEVFSSERSSFFF